MKIKSLLLGWTAAFVVVSGAQAADAVVAAEPEPVEYVKVCDAYGTGFFYIPGTETCLKISGTLRYEKRFSKTGDEQTLYDNHSRLRLDIETKNDSEWGTVYSWVRFEGDQYNNGSAIDGSGATDALKWYYYFGIGGLEFGNWDSQWAKFFGDTGGFTDDGGIYQTDWDFPDSRQYISYMAEFGSVKAYISFDNDADEYYQVTRDASGHIIYRGEDHAGYAPGNGIEKPHRGSKYMPDVTGGASTVLGDWEVAGGVAYDESDQSVALKGLIAGNFGMFGVRFMPLWSASDQNIYFAYEGFSAILGLQAKVTDTITLSKDIQFWDDGSWRLVGDVDWQVASGFSVLLEGIYYDLDNGPTTKSGMIRFQRAF